MGKLFSGAARFLIRQAVTLLLILGVLLGAAWVNNELKSAERLRAERTSEAARKDDLAARIEGLKSSAAERFRKADAMVRNHESILARLRADRDRLSEKHFFARNIPLSGAWQEIRFLDLQIAAAETAVAEAHRLKDVTGKELHAQLARAELEMEQINGRIGSIDEALNKGFGPRLAAVIRQELPVALAVLAGILLLPLATKVFLYFIVAPWAAARPPIRLLPSASGTVASPSMEDGGRGRMSAVSQAIVLAENQELLIQPDYLQSTSLQARKRTRWLLNAGIPFSSLLSGMYMLTRVGPAGADPVVISATRDPLSEVGIVGLADGAAFVCQPRSLAGVIQDPSHPVRITRHWRLGLQSWLTLQLRYLVFHGPGQLVIKGCRGIRIEPAGTGRLINQTATLGFSANLAYANTRCETFVSYWSGKENLFNDLFTGEPGVYVYEEMPGLKRAGGAGRHLEGFVDSLLKVFGV